MNGIWLYVGVIVGIIGMLLITVLNRGDIARIRASGMPEVQAGGIWSGVTVAVRD